MSVDHAAIWERFIATALLGTEREDPAPAVVPLFVQAGGGGESSGEAGLGAILASLDQNDREGFLLAAAATLAVYRRAGTVPPVGQAFQLAPWYNPIMYQVRGPLTGAPA